jgi:hypothetical protein
MGYTTASSRTPSEWLAFLDGFADAWNRHDTDAIQEGLGTDARDRSERS